MKLLHLSVSEAPSKEQQQNQISSRNLISFKGGVLETNKEVCHSCAVYTFLLFRILKGKELGPSYTSYLNLNLNWNDHCPTRGMFVNPINSGKLKKPS